ncbi:post-GPI attachment to proteins factor 2 isoform X12 [Equus asinus]|uniref:post-GPI attachment to proteins factor 2 isoform X12 n=1 Tax=Equus asinus TaxID=9793 RepID=UPI0038F62E17
MARENARLRGRARGPGLQKWGGAGRGSGRSFLPKFRPERAGPAPAVPAPIRPPPPLCSPPPHPPTLGPVGPGLPQWSPGTRPAPAQPPRRHILGLTRCTRSQCRWTGMGPWSGSASPWWPWSQSAVHLSPSSSASSGPCSSTSRRLRPHTVGHPRKCFHCVHRHIPQSHAPHLHSLAADQEAHSKSGGSKVLQLETAALHHQLYLLLHGAGCLLSAQHVL